MPMPTMDKQPPLSRNSTITSTSSQRSNPQSLNGDYQRRDSGIYKGISDRPLGWKRVSNRAAKASQQLGITAGEMKIRKWDGAARMSTDWDGLRRDPDLWYGQSGDCLVHLYGKGQSKRAPTFKVPMGKLVEINAQPLLKRFLVERIDEGTSSDDESSSASHIELYIPAPMTAERGQAFLYHTATRNFFAWMFGRSLVGCHLGGALVGLLNSMNEFRSQGEDNVRALLEYMDEEGYTDMRNSPDHALGILFFAEHFRFKDIWVDAFGHCVGMNERLIASPGFEYISRTSRALITRSRYEMDMRLDLCGRRLSSFLSDELSDAHLGIPPAARAHLDRFRSFLQSYYIAKLGYYPPSCQEGTRAFPQSVFRQMTSEFQKLYEFLVDNSLTASDPIPMAQQGGICVLQNINAFDQRFKHTTLDHPLPLVPESDECTSPRTGLSKRFNWAKLDKMTPDSRLVTLASLSKATNSRQSTLTECTLVRAYRGFEKDCVFSPSKADKQDKLSHADARKVRWLLIYSVLQTLLAATKIPDEICDIQNVPYNLCVVTAGCPLWKEERRLETLMRTQTNQSKQDFEQSIQKTTYELNSPLDRVEIKPDIDWDAITHRSQHGSANSDTTRTPTKNVRRALSSLGSMPELQHPKPNRVSFHEILVQGYGNGTNVATHTPTEQLAMVGPAEHPIRKSSTDSHASTAEYLSSRWSNTSDEEHEGVSSVSSTSRRESLASVNISETNLQIQQFLDHDRGISALGLARVPSGAYSPSLYDQDDPAMEPEPLQVYRTSEQEASKQAPPTLPLHQSTLELEDFLGLT